MQSKLDKKSYVIKVVDITRLGDKELKMAKNEANVLSLMHHPNIIGYLGTFIEKGRLHIIMDYAQGGDLQQRIDRQKGKLFNESVSFDWQYTFHQIHSDQFPSKLSTGSFKSVWPSSTYMITMYCIATSKATIFFSPAKIMYASEILA